MVADTLRTTALAMTDSSADARAASFRALLDRHLDAAYRLAAVILGDPVEAEDAVYDAAVSAWRAWATLRDPTRFDAWFARILVNGCRDRLRSRRRRPVILPLRAGEEGLAQRSGHATESRSGAVSPDPALEVVDRVVLDRAIDGLDPDHRVVVVLRYFGDLPVEVIAERLGIPAGTVKSRLHHALHRLRDALEAVDR